MLVWTHHKCILVFPCLPLGEYTSVIPCYTYTCILFCWCYTPLLTSSIHDATMEYLRSAIESTKMTPTLLFKVSLLGTSTYFYVAVYIARHEMMPLPPSRVYFSTHEAAASVVQPVHYYYHTPQTANAASKANLRS